MSKSETTYKERYYKLIAFVLQSQPQNPEAISAVSYQAQVRSVRRQRMKQIARKIAK